MPASHASKCSGRVNFLCTRSAIVTQLRTEKRHLLHHNGRHAAVFNQVRFVHGAKPALRQLLAQLDVLLCVQPRISGPSATFVRMFHESSQSSKRR